MKVRRGITRRRAGSSSHARKTARRVGRAAAAARRVSGRKRGQEQARTGTDQDRRGSETHRRNAARRNRRPPAGQGHGLRRAFDRGFRRQGDAGGRAGVGGVPDVVRVADTLFVALGVPLRPVQRHGSALHTPRAWPVPRLPRVPCIQALAARLRPVAGLAVRHRGRGDGTLSDRLLQGTVAAAGQPDRARRRGRHRRNPAAARGHAARGRTADGGPRGALFGVCHGRAAPARRHRAQGRFDPACCFAHVDGDRRRVRHRARRVGQFYLRLRAVRHAARPRRWWQLHDAGELCAAGPSARRTGQGGRRVLGPERTDFGLFGQQRRVGWHLHDPADEARRLRRREGGGDRDLVVGQRPDHAAGDGGGGVPDGRIRRHSLLGHRQARLHPGGHQLHRALLHRASRGAEARPGGDRT